MKTSDLALLVVAITQAPHVGQTNAMLFSGFMLVVAIVAVWAERK
jgi:hypothetical protein